MSTRHDRPVTRLACDRCHNQKLRCVRGPTAGDPCERCLKVGRSCTYSPPLRLGRPSHKRKPNDRRRGITPPSLRGEPRQQQGSIPSNREPISSNTRSQSPRFEQRTIFKKEPEDDDQPPVFDSASFTVDQTVPTASQDELDVPDAEVLHSNEDISDMSLPDSFSGQIGLPGFNDFPKRLESLDAQFPLFETNQSYDSIDFDLFHDSAIPQLNVDPPEEAGFESTSGIEDLQSPFNFESEASPESALFSEYSCEIPGPRDPMVLLSELQLKLCRSSTATFKPSDCTDWTLRMDEALQYSQELLDALSQLVSPSAACFSPASPGLSGAGFGNCSCELTPPSSYKENIPNWDALEAAHSSQCGTSVSTSCLQTPPPTPTPASLDPAGTLLILTCYMRILQTFDHLSNILLQCVKNPGSPFTEALSLPRIQIGSFRTLPSPTLHIALLVQLVTHTVDEIKKQISTLLRTTDGNPPVQGVESVGARNTSDALSIAGLAGAEIVSLEARLKQNLESTVSMLKSS